MANRKSLAKPKYYGRQRSSIPDVRNRAIEVQRHATSGGLACFVLAVARALGQGVYVGPEFEAPPPSEETLSLIFGG